MRTSELIELLKEKLELHGDLEVATVWEHYCVQGIDKKDVYLGTNGKLLIDAENGGNKKEHAVDQKEGEPTMKADMIYLETCLPDFFNGHGAQVYNIDPYGTTGDVRDRLLEAIDQEELFLPDGESATDEHCDQLKEAVTDMFEGLDVERTWDSRLEEPETEEAETPYSYFGVLWLEE